MNNKNITIAIVGPHYAGKSTLSELLSKEINATIIKEKWWKDPYRVLKPRDYFRSEVWYLLQALESIDKAKKLNKSGKNVILDTFIYSSLVFGKTKMKKDDYEIYKKIVDKASNYIPLPDVVIFLHADPKFLHSVRRMQRVEAGTGPKEDIETPLEWLAEIASLNHELFDNWKKTPLIKIDVEKNNIKDIKVIEEIVKKISSFSQKK